MPDSYDYIIVGAGSAGCVLADRLTRDGRSRVLLLEAGGRNEGPMVDMPKGMARTTSDPSMMWFFKVDQPRIGANEATDTWVRGKGLGGSSSVNGMIYIRGQPQDYDGWKALGATGWGWAEMKQAFRSIEDHELGDDGVRGAGGPVHINVRSYRYPLAERMIEAGQQMGLPRHEDLNREDQEGIGYFPHNIKRGRRQSAALAFLKPALKRANLKVVTHAEVDRVLFEGRRAVGVAAQVNGGPMEFRAAGEVIVCGGTLMSPIILQRSGVGPGGLLQDRGVAVVADRRDVGRRMREHVGLSNTYRLQNARGNNWRFRGAGLALSLAEYWLLRSGPMTTGPYEVGAFVRTRPDLDRPDLQLYAAPITLARPTASSGKQSLTVQMAGVEDKPGATIYGQLLHMTSEGRVEITARDPSAAISVEPNWLSTPEDQRTVVEAYRLLRRYARQPALAPYIGEELAPGAALETDEDLLRAAHARTTSGTHAVATCRMGGDADSVVDARARVRGVEGLRVVDCSIMPTTVSGNTNGPAMAVGWRAADLILEDRP